MARRAFERMRKTTTPLKGGVGLGRDLTFAFNILYDGKRELDLNLKGRIIQIHTFSSADILIPRSVDMEKTVGEARSAYCLILPEIKLAGDYRMRLKNKPKHEGVFGSRSVYIALVGVCLCGTGAA